MGGLKLGVGYNLNDNTKVKPLFLQDEYRKRHMWIFGTTGVGKTKLAESFIEQDIANGNTVVFIDPKGDGSIFNKIVQMAKAHNRLDELMLITTVFPEYSVHFNPLKHFFMIEEQVSHIVSGIETGKEPFFGNVAYEISLALVMTDHLLRYGSLDNIGSSPSNPYTLINVLNEMSHSSIEKLREKVLKFNTPEARQLAANLEKIFESGQDYYNKVSSSLRVALMEECNGNIGQIIGKTYENPFMDRLESGKSSILVIQLGSLLARKASCTAGKIILSSLQAYIGRVYASGKTIQPALSIHIDEAHSVLYQGIEDLFSKAGSANVYLHGYCQSLDQMYSSVSEDYANSILSNCNTKIFMRVTHPATAEYISSHFGVKRTLLPVISSDGSITFRDGEAERVKPDNIMELQPRHFYMVTYEGKKNEGQYFYGKTTDVLPTTTNVIFPDSRSKISAN